MVPTNIDPTDFHCMDDKETDRQTDKKDNSKYPRFVPNDFWVNYSFDGLMNLALEV